MYARCRGFYGEVVNEKRRTVIANGRDEKWEKLVPMSDTEYKMLTTPNIQILAQGGRSKMWESVLRQYPSVEDAKQYLNYFVSDDKITTEDFSVKNTHYVVRTNYPVKLILDGVQPKGRLQDMALPHQTTQFVRRAANGKAAQLESVKPSSSPVKSEQKRKREPEIDIPPGSLIDLSDVCKKYNLDGKKVRRWLRKSPIPKRGTWKFTQDEVKNILEAVK